MQLARSFSTCARVLRSGYSTVEPVHHLVKINKPALKPGMTQLLKPKSDITAIGFKPVEISQDRVREHYNNTVKSDLMLHLYEHDANTIEGQKFREWGTDSPYKMYRSMKKPRGKGKATRNIKPITSRNVPELQSIVINLYSPAIAEHKWLSVSARAFIAQITNVKPQLLRNRSNVIGWKIRVGRPCGCKVELKDRDMHQFLSTLTELVLPRIRTFTGLKPTTGDTHGNISMGLTEEDVKYFPEVEHFQDLFPNLFGFHITFKTTARTDEQARTLISSLGFPFQK